jgi:hypothetical protein
MASGLVVPISGPVSGTWNAKSLGIQNDEGYELSCTIQGQEINASDVFGMSLMEGIYRGQNWKLRFRGLEWNKAGLLDLLQMFGQPGGTGTFSPSYANIGDRWTNYCKSLVLTAILANPPTTPQTLTAMNAGISPNSQSAFNMTSKMREFPLELVLIPYTATVSGVTTVIPFSTT